MTNVVKLNYTAQEIDEKLGAVDTLSDEKVNLPKDTNGIVQNGKNGQILQTNGDGTTQWVESEQNFTKSNFKFAIGAIASATGASNTNKTRMNSNSIYVNDRMSTITIGDNYSFNWFAYDIDKVYLGYSGGWIKYASVSDIKNLYPNVAYIRICFREESDRNMSYEDVALSNISINSSMLSEIKNILNITNTTELNFISASIDSYGNESNSNTRLRSDSIDFNKEMCVYVYPEYKVYIHFYNNENEYIGNSGVWLTGNICLSNYSNINLSNGETGTPAYFRLVMATRNDAIVTDLDKHIHNIVVYQPSALTKMYQSIEDMRFNYYDCGLPILYLYGDTSLMTKDNAVTLNYNYMNKSGTCTCKWQGSSSIAYPKKNYTIKFDTEFSIVNKWTPSSSAAGQSAVSTNWGAQRKFCMKANWVDPSALRNIVCARLWSQVVASREEINNNLVASPNYGAIDGYPIIIVINGRFNGLYTFNIPKDGWMFNMGEGTNEYLVVGKLNNVNVGAGSNFKATATFDGDYEIEYKPDDVEDSTVADSFNRLIQATIDAESDWETVLAPYLDIDSVFDYFIFVNCIAGIDNLGNNVLYGTYDGTKWFMTAYDLDSTFGCAPYGDLWMKVVNHRNQFFDCRQWHRLAHLMCTYSKEKLIARYKQLRSTVLSDENVWYMLNNFVTNIPKAVYELDNKRWSTMPATSAANVHNYMDYYRMHCAYLDKEIETLASNLTTTTEE